jgi:hypothetical protein
MKPLKPRPSIDENLFQITYHIGFDLHPQQQDAIFYTGMGCIATVKYEGFSVDVYCDGETRANLLDAPQGSTVSTLYHPSDFIDAGIDTDDALKMANEQELLDWVNNSWFDLYCYGEHLDCVEHEINEAIAKAKAYVAQEWIEAEEFMS